VKDWEYNETIHQLFVEFKKACDSIKGKVLCNILLQFKEPMKLVRLIKPCLNVLYSKDNINNHFSDNFPIQNGIKQGDALSPLLFDFDLEYAIRKAQES
jgi:hypothetical protein